MQLGYQPNGAALVCRGRVVLIVGKIDKTRSIYARGLGLPELFFLTLLFSTR